MKRNHIFSLLLAATLLISLCCASCCKHSVPPVPDVQAFKKTYDAATALVEQYNRDFAAWERQVHGGQQTQQKPSEKGSIRKKLRDMEAEAKRRNAERRQEPRHRSYDYDRGR